MATATFRRPAPSASDLPGYLCARLKDPPKAEYVRREIMERVDAPEVLVSEHDILDGIAAHTALGADR